MDLLSSVSYCQTTEVSTTALWNIQRNLCTATKTCTDFFQDTCTFKVCPNSGDRLRIQLSTCCILLLHQDKFVQSSFFPTETLDYHRQSHWTVVNHIHSTFKRLADKHKGPAFSFSSTLSAPVQTGQVRSM